MTAIAIEHRDEIIEQVATGAYLRDIASKYGVQAPAIAKHLAKDPDYQAARELALEARLEKREEELETAPPTMAEISRASGLLRQAQWRCEREAPHRWASRAHVTVEHTGDIDAKLRAAEERMRTVDGTCERVQPQQIAAPVDTAPNTP